MMQSLELQNFLWKEYVLQFQHLELYTNLEDVSFQFLYDQEKLKMT